MSAGNTPFAVEGEGEAVKTHDIEAQLNSQGQSMNRNPAWLRFVGSPLTHEAIAAISCLLLALVLEIATPRSTYVLKETLYQHSYPVKPNSVPSATVPLYALLGPLAVFVAYRFTSKRPAREIARLAIGLCLAFFLTGAITNCLKLPVGRLRPNFVRTCWPNGTLVFKQEDQWGGYAVCDPGVEGKDVDEVRKSWPSGHSSLSASGLGFLTFFLLGQLRPFACPARSIYAGVVASTAPPVAGRQWRFLLALLPSFGAVAVGVTRVLDYWHFPSDVLTGLAIGFLTSFFVYRLLYPPLTHPRSDLPWEAIERAEQAAAQHEAGELGEHLITAAPQGE